MPEGREHALHASVLRPAGRALPFTLFCMPPKPRAAKRPSQSATASRAVEDESDDFTVWAAGTVVAVDYSVAADAEALVPQREWTGAAAVVPYRIELDISRVAVLVHKDEHWLVRDLALQAAGPRQAADGSRCLARLEKRQRVGGGGWEVVDHATRHVRVRAARLRRRGVAHSFRPR